jgi:PAS domain S-box-containing protein
MERYQIRAGYEILDPDGNWVYAMTAVPSNPVGLPVKSDNDTGSGRGGLKQKTSSEMLVERQKPLLNRLSMVLGLAVTLIGVTGLLGMFFSQPILLTYTPFGRATEFSTIIALLFLGIGLITILDSHAYDIKPRWLWPVRHLGWAVPTAVGFYWLFTYLMPPDFDLIDISTYGIHTVSLFTASFLALAGITLLLFLTLRRHESVIAYGVCIPALVVFNIGLLVIIGYSFNVPLLYGFKMALPNGIASLMTGFALLIGSLPFKGLLLPLFSHNKKARLLAYFTVILGTAFILFTISRIALSLLHSHVTDIALLTTDMRHYYTETILVAGFVAVTFKVIGLRASRYLSQSILFTSLQEHAYKQERLKRTILETISHTEDVSQALHILTRQIGEAYQAERCLLVLYDKNDTNQVSRLVQYNIPPANEVRIEDLPRHTDALKSVSDPVALVRYNSPADFPPYYQPYADKYKPKAALGFDLIQWERYYGRLVLNRCVEPHIWTDAELNLLHEISQMVGVAVRQAEIDAEEKRIRRTLEESEQRFRLLIEGLKDYAIYLVDARGVINIWNQGAERLLGYKDHEIIGKPLSTFFTQVELNSGLLDRELAVAAQEGRFEVEGWRKRKNGSQFWANVVIRPLWDGEGNLYGYASIIRDMTERKQVEEELVQSEARLRTLVDSNMLGIFEWDKQTGLITEANDAFLELLDYTKEDVLFGKVSWIELTPPEFLELDMRNYEQMTTHPLGRCEPYEKQLITRNGERIDILVASAFYKGQWQKGVSCVLDISQRKQAEQALVESQRQLAESNRDLEQFAAIASHDLQAPLRKVRLFSDMIYENAKGKVDASTLDLIDRSKRSLESAQNMVRDLLALSKISKEEQVFRTVELSKVLYRVLTNLDQEIRQKHAKVIIHSTETITADEAQLEHLLQNLISNALKYQPDGQEPVIQVESSCSAAGFCQFSIQDNGIGIPPEQAERIFEPFARLHPKSSPYEGTGIGLAICRRIVERHGGSIAVESELDKGSKFIIRLPHHLEPTGIHKQPSKSRMESAVNLF